MPSLRSTQDLLGSLKLDLAFVNRIYVQEKLMMPDSSLTVFSSWEKNWYQRPPAAIRLNGVLQAPSTYILDYDEGTVTFPSAKAISDYVVAEFYFSMYSDSELIDFLTRSVQELATLLSETIHTTAILDQYQQVILDLTWCTVFHAIMAETANYHKWVADGVEIHKDLVTKNFRMILDERIAKAERLLARLRWNDLNGGDLTPTLNILGSN